MPDFKGIRSVSCYASITEHMILTRGSVAAVAAIRTLGFILQLSVEEFPSLRRTAEAFIDLMINNCMLSCFDYGFLAKYRDCIVTYPLHAKGTNIKT